MNGFGSAPATRDAQRRANRRLLDVLAAVWDEVPEQRFGQFVMNVSRDPDGFADTWEWKHGEWHARLVRAYREWAKPADLGVAESATQEGPHAA